MQEREILALRDDVVKFFSILIQKEKSKTEPLKTLLLFSEEIILQLSAKKPIQIKENKIKKIEEINNSLEDINFEISQINDELQRTTGLPPNELFQFISGKKKESKELLKLLNINKKLFQSLEKNKTKIDKFIQQGVKKTNIEIRKVLLTEKIKDQLSSLFLK